MYLGPGKFALTYANDLILIISGSILITEVGKLLLVTVPRNYCKCIRTNSIYIVDYVKLVWAETPEPYTMSKFML